MEAVTFAFEDSQSRYRAILSYPPPKKTHKIPKGFPEKMLSTYPQLIKLLSDLNEPQV